MAYHVLAPNMSQPTPMSRCAMQNLKAEKDEELRVTRITNLANSIYSYAVDTARKGDTSYNYAIPLVSPTQTTMVRSKSLGVSFPAPYKKSSDPFHLENMSDILIKLHSLFPECSISHSIMAKGTDGKLYDISKLDDTALAFVDRALEQSYIVIDWS